MRHGSLFSGIGGFDLAAQWMGWENVFHCEIDPYCRKVLKHYWPNAESFEDIKQTDFGKYSGTVDIISGGFPCQPYSTAGKRLGKDDTRHLWPEMLRVIREVRPTWVVGENVRGLISWNAGMVFNEVHTDLENEGYEVWAFVLPACGVNAPHRRDRVWFVAHAKNCGDTGGPREVFQTNGRQDGQMLSESGEPSDGPPQNPDGNGWPSDIGQSQSGIRGFGNAGTGDHEWVHQQSDAGVIADATGDRRERERQGIENENGQQKSGINRELERGFERFCQNGYATHTGGIGQQGQGRDASPRNPEAGSNGQANWFNNGDERWERFPTQSPVCGRNDGVPGGLDGITFPKWRKESIKSYGNAVVPQVVYHIFKCIEQLNPAPAVHYENSYEHIRRKDKCISGG